MFDRKYVKSYYNLGLGVLGTRGCLLVLSYTL